MYIYHIFFIHSSVDGHLGCFHVLAIVNNAEINNGITVSLSILISSGYMTRRGIAGSYGGCLENPMDGGAWWATVHGVSNSRTQLRDFTFTFHFHALEKEMATHTSVLAWRIPGTGSLAGCHLWGHTESDTTEAT